MMSERRDRGQLSLPLPLSTLGVSQQRLERANLDRLGEMMRPRTAGSYLESPGWPPLEATGHINCTTDQAESLFQPLTR
jgi:hypothetical protein